MSSAAANRRGIAAMLAAMTLFTASDTFVKLAAGTLPPGQIMAVRGVFAVTIMVATLLALGHGAQLKALGNRRVLIRSAIEGVIALLFITSIGHLPLANINSILQATPIILTLAVAAMGLERVGWRRWLAVLAGFAGVLLIVKPTPAGVDFYAVLALACAVLVAARDLVTRSIQGHVSTPVVTLAAASTVTILGTLLWPLEDWQPLGTRDLVHLGSAAFFVTLGNLAVVKAFRIGEISVVSPFRYSMVVIALAAGFLVFDEVPDWAAAFGIVLIVGSGLYTLRREQIRQRESSAAEAVPVRKAA